MNILDLMPNFKTKDGGDTNPDDAAYQAEKRRQERNHGPRPVRHITNGQIRRMMEREAKTRRRKMNERHRRAWMRNRLATAVLRGQLEALNKAILGEGTETTVYHPRVQPIVRDLEAKFGSVKAAQERYDAILAEAA